MCNRRALCCHLCPPRASAASCSGDREVTAASEGFYHHQSCPRAALWREKSAKQPAKAALTRVPFSPLAPGNPGKPIEPFWGRKKRGMGLGHWTGWLCLAVPGARWPEITPAKLADVCSSWCFFFFKPSSNKNKIEDRPEMTSEAKFSPKITNQNKKVHASLEVAAKAQAHARTRCLGNSRLLCLAPKSLCCT